MPVDYTLRARVVVYVFDGEYSLTYTAKVPLLAVVLCLDPNAPQTVQEIVAFLQPLPNIRYYALYGGIVAYSGVLPPTFFAEVFAYAAWEWLAGTQSQQAQERYEELEEVITEALHLMQDLEPGMSVAPDWIAERRQLSEKVTSLKAHHKAEKLQESMEEDGQ